MNIHDILNGNLFTMHKEAGKLRPTCRLVNNAHDVPDFLIKAGAVTVTGDTITMMAVEGPATRTFPIFLSWEETDKLECGYGACHVHTSWGEVREAPMPQSEAEHTAVLINYGDGSVNLLTLSEKSAAEYIIVDDNGQDIGKLLDIVQ